MIRKYTEPTSTPEVSNLTDQYAELLRLRQQVLHAESHEFAIYQKSGPRPAANSGDRSQKKQG
jgi:hypothetical protein